MGRLLKPAALDTEAKAKPLMKNTSQYFFEFAFLVIVILLAVTGFWDIYFGKEANPDPYQHMHLVINLTWLFLLLYQLSLIGKGSWQQHRKVGVAILVMGPLLFASTALLSVHSANKGLVSGEGDFLIVQNVMGTLELGFFILLAFILRKRSKLHGYLLLSTAVLFMGIALFFTLISFVPTFKIEGPDTFYRFQTAAITGQAICLGVGLIFLIKDFRNAWPMLLAGVFFLLNEAIRSYLTKQDLIQPLTEFVGSMNQTLTFAGSFALIFAVLMAVGIQKNVRLGTTTR